ncbi:hypothetical protein K439DRAFT_1615082 [Ramaria rubella]|nr:hypothetical protein K439DRAFT_1615082 [Ramaria rubella]
MEFWPADFKVDASSSTKKKRKGKEVYRLNEQTIVPGTLGAATLGLTQLPLQWNTILQPPRKSIFCVGNQAEVFPPTRPPPVNFSRLTAHQRAEQGARFLRTYYPDVDISFELLKDELQSDDEEAEVYSVLDPYAGNKLVQFSMETRRKQVTQFLAFPCGETGADLNISPFRQTKDRRLLFSPSAFPALTFDTPIQQIIALAPKEAAFQKHSFLAVRTHAMVSMVKLQGNPNVHAKAPPAIAKVIAPISVSETGNRRIVDMSCPHSSTTDSQILLVNDMGGVYKYGMQDNNKTISLAPDVAINEDSELDHFWRLAWKDDYMYLRASSKRVHMVDIRSRATLPQELLHLSDSGEYLTSLEGPLGKGHTMCLSTTSKLLWFDERNLKRPVLSLKHQRAFDRSLRMQSVTINQSTLATLSSTANHLVTVYDINHSHDGHIQLHGEPSLMPSSSSLDFPLSGSLFFQNPDDGLGLSHFQLTSRGSLRSVDLRVTDEPFVIDAASGPIGFEWSEEMHTLAEKVQTLSHDIGSFGEREFFEADLRGIYQKVFDVRDITAQVEGDPEAVYQTLEKMPFFWQDMNGPIDHMLTTFDVAFQCGLEPIHASRADFLTESLLSSSRGFMALTRGRVPISRLSSSVRWHHDMRSLPPNMVPDLSAPSHTLVDELREEASEYAATPEGMKRVTEATQHLVLDLALSRHVYAPQSFTKTGVDDENHSDMLSQATKAMSLAANEPPQVRFGYLRPVAKAPYDDDEEMESGSESTREVDLKMPLSVRLLVDQWNVGSSPEEYIYKNPYEEPGDSRTTESAVPIRRINEGTVGVGQHIQHGTSITMASAPRPPLVVTTTSQQVMTNQVGPIASTHQLQRILDSSPPREVRFLHGQTPPSRSQLEGDHRAESFQGPSTQPLSGPFGGGGKVGSKKKLVKKRLGGTWVKTLIKRANFGAYRPTVLAATSLNIAYFKLEQLRTTLAVLHGWSQICFTNNLIYDRPSNLLMHPDVLHDTLRRNKPVVSAITASLVSTLAGYPLDSLKSRLQASRVPITVPRLAAQVFREEGIAGFYRGFWIPLITISFVRAASFTIYNGTKEALHERNRLAQARLGDVAGSGALGGALAGAVICFGSAPFELVKVRRQLEFSIAEAKGIHLTKPPSTMQAVIDIIRQSGVSGLYNGFRLHFLRDTSGTALYFLEYDSMRHLFGRLPTGEQGKLPSWLPLHPSLLPFLCGSLSGVTSWALIYPLDVVKTKVQQRALSGAPKRSPDTDHPKPILLGLSRLYRGLGVSAARSVITHGLLWTVLDYVSQKIDSLPRLPTRTA